MAIADKMPDQYKLRGGVYFVNAFPMTASGKVLRRKLKEEVQRIYNEKSISAKWVVGSGCVYKLLSVMIPG